MGIGSASTATSGFYCAYAAGIENPDGRIVIITIILGCVTIVVIVYGYDATATSGFYCAYAAGIENPDGRIVIITINVGFVTIVIIVYGPACKDILGTEAHCHHKSA
jgi:hypothetical protein